jgi:hypothetical protein
MCRAPLEEKMKSNKRRKRLAQIQYHLQHEPITIDELKAIALEFFDLVEKERLTPKLPDYYTDFMSMYYAWGDLEESVKYGELALKWLEGLGTRHGREHIHEVRGFVNWLKAKSKNKKGS